VGAGARLGDVYDALQDQDLTIPGGTCPSVGAAGLTLGGGPGILGRKHGVTCDHLIGAEVVLADGRILECDEAPRGGLVLGAPRAGAGNFGVVTTLLFQAMPAPKPELPPGVGVLARRRCHRGLATVGTDRTRRAGCEPEDHRERRRRPPARRRQSTARSLRSGAHAADLVEELAGRVGSEAISTTLTHMTHPQTPKFWAELGDAGRAAGGSSIADPTEQVCLCCKSEFFSRPLPGEAVGALLETFLEGWTSGESRELDFMPWGVPRIESAPTPAPSSIATSCSSSSTPLYWTPTHLRRTRMQPTRREGH
jgi:hypothetical protein